MDKKGKNSEENLIIKEEKIRDKEYLKELQRFLDLADNISDEKLKKRIIYQMLKCNEIITRICEKRIICNKTK